MARWGQTLVRSEPVMKRHESVRRDLKRFDIVPKAREFGLQLDGALIDVLEVLGYFLTPSRLMLAANDLFILDAEALRGRALVERRRFALGHEVDFERIDAVHAQRIETAKKVQTVVDQVQAKVERQTLPDQKRETLDGIVLPVALPLLQNAFQSGDEFRAWFTQSLVARTIVTLGINTVDVRDAALAEKGIEVLPLDLATGDYSEDRIPPYREHGISHWLHTFPALIAASSDAVVAEVFKSRS